MMLGTTNIKRVEICLYPFLNFALNAREWAVPTPLEGGWAPHPVWTFLRMEEISCPCQG